MDECSDASESDRVILSQTHEERIMSMTGTVAGQQATQAVSRKDGVDAREFHERVMEVQDTLTMSQRSREAIADGAQDGAGDDSVIRLLARWLQDVINQVGEHFHTSSGHIGTR